MLAVLILRLRCTASPKRFEEPATRRTPTHTETVQELLNPKALWVEFGIDDGIIVSVPL
jgi:hypothetical protein